MPPLIDWAAPVDDDPRNPWFSWEYVRQNIDSLTTALQQHLSLTFVAVAVAAVIGIPLAVVAWPPPGCCTQSRPWPCSR